MVEIKLRKEVLLIVLVICTLSFGPTVMERKVVIPEGGFDSYYLHSFSIFLTRDGKASILIDDLKHLFLYTQNNLKTVDIDRKNNIFLNGFVENDHAMLAFVISPERYRYSGINIYDIQKGFGKPAAYIKIPIKLQDTPLGRLIPVPQMPGKYYILSNQETFLGVEAFTRCLGGGHISGYAKPYLAEINNGEISEYKKIKYGGKKYEDFNIKEYVSTVEMIHCLGLRHPKEHDGVLEPNSPVVLYYACYNPKEEQVVRSSNIYEIKSGPGSYKFGPLSLAVNDSNAFIVFSFHKYPFRGSPQNDIQKITSDIYYFQCDNNSTVNAVKIAKGFVPLVKLDSAGNVYVFWLDYNGNIVYKTKKDDRWSDERIILTGATMVSDVIFKKYFSVEFDEDNNLHVVFRTSEGIVYTKLKLE